MTNYFQKKKEREKMIRLITYQRKEFFEKTRKKKTD